MKNDKQVSISARELWLLKNQSAAHQAIMTYDARRRAYSSDHAMKIRKLKTFLAVLLVKQGDSQLELFDVAEVLTPDIADILTCA